MKFLDSNVILYAYLKPKKGLKLPERIAWRKERSREIIKSIEEGSEEVLISVVHLGEILNILSKKLSTTTAIMFLARVLQMNNIVIVEVNKVLYENALSLSITENIEPNDALAVIVMKKHRCSEILTFDYDFYDIKQIKKPLLEEEARLFGKP